jgi:AcrR family transcriptional regulator
MPTDRFEQRKLTRSKLIDAALKLFSTSGYEHATVDDISQAAGYSKGAYYFHFSTKDDILIELLRMWTEDRTSALEAHVEDGAVSRESLVQTLAAFFTYEEPRWPGVLLEFWSQALRHEEVSKRLSQAYAGWRKQIAGAFDAAATSGAVAVDSSDEAAGLALAAHDGYAVQVAIGSPVVKTISAGDLAESLISPIEKAAAAERRTAAAR